jgi:hypothetical protein
MSEEDRSIEIAKAAWKSQEVDAPTVSIDYLQLRAFDHEKRTRNRSVVECFLGCVAVIMSAWFLTKIDSLLFRVGALVMLAGIFYSLFELWRRRSVWTATPEGSASDGLTFYKQELARLRDLHRSLWKIYLPAGIPGAIILLIWASFARPETGNGHKIVLAAAVAVWIIVALRHEAQEADRYQRELEALEKNG